MERAALVLVLVFVAGYATQRGSTCAVSAAQEIVSERRVSRLAGFFLCASVSLALMAIAHLAGIPEAGRGKDPAVSFAIVSGGALFGVGAYVNGRCAFGTIARLGSGELSRIGTLAGFLLGSIAALSLKMDGGISRTSQPLLMLDAPAMLMCALLAIAVTGAVCATGRDQANAGWSTPKAMIVIGLVNGTLLLLAQGWSYTSLLMNIARGHVEAPFWHGLIVAALVIGAIAGALSGGTFHMRPGNIRQWAVTLSGGALMGLGASLVPGGNDRMLMQGVPMLLPNLVAAYCVMMLTLVGMIIVVGKRQ